MKKLPLNNPHFEFLEKSFREWLEILGFSHHGIYTLPIHVRELLHYIEQKGISHIKSVTVKDIREYYSQLKTRTNHIKALRLKLSFFPFTNRRARCHCFCSGYILSIGQRYG